MHTEYVAPISGRTSPKGVLARLFEILSPPAQPETPVEAAERRATERDAARLEMAHLRTVADAELPKLAAEEEKARRHLEKLTPAYQEATRAYDLARTAHSRRAHDLAYAGERQSRRVHANFEPVITEFMAGLIEALEATIATPVVNEERNHEWDARTQRTVAEGWSNAPSIEARRAAVLAAYHDAEALKSDPDQDNLRERFAAIIAGLPDPEIMVKVYEPPPFEPPVRYRSREEEIAERTGNTPLAPEERRRLLARRGIRHVV